MHVRIEASVTTDVDAELIRRALLDFSDRRTDIWPQLDPDTYDVHWVKETSAEITEGTPRPKVWSREHYDWSHPTIISWTAVESNFCTPGSHVSMDIQPRDTGGSTVTVVWDRTSANAKGWLNLAVVRLGGKRLLTWATNRSLQDVAAAYRDDSEA